MAVQPENELEAKLKRNGHIAVTAMVLAGVAGFFGTGLYVWPDLLYGLHSGRYPIVLLVVYFLIGPAIVAAVSGAVVFFIAMIALEGMPGSR